MKLIMKILFIFLGTIFIILGIIGLILPVMPSTIFFMVAGLCYINSSKTLYRRLIKLNYIGPTIESYVERREVTYKFKILSMLFLYIPTIITQIFIVKDLIYRIIPITILLFISWHILSLKTVDEEKIKTNTNKHDSHAK